MKVSRCSMGDFGISTRPISFAPAIKANKDKLLLKFRNKLGAKGYSPAEAMGMAAKVRAEANDLAIEMNARQGNDDPVRMANIHTLALKLKIKQALAAAPSKTMQGEGLGRISKTSPMAVSVADKGKAYDTHIVKNRARARDAKRAKGIYDAEMSRKMRGLMKDDILREAMRTSYMQQFNGSMGHYGAMGIKFSKPKIIAKAQKAGSAIAKPVAQAAKYTAKSAVRAAQEIKKDPLAFATKVAIAPVSLIASAAPAHTDLGKLARKVESGTIKFVKATADVIKKVLNFIWDKIIVAAWEFIKKYLKKTFDWFGKLIKNLKEKLWNKFHGDKGISGMGEMGADEKDEEMKHIEKSVLRTANRLKAKGEGAFASGLKTFAMKDIAAGAGAAAGAAAVEGTMGTQAVKTILTAGAGAATLAGEATITYLAAASPVTSQQTVKASPQIGEQVIKDIGDIAFDEACKDYGNDLAARKLKNSPIAQAVVQQSINGELKGNIETVTAVATGITDPAKRQEFIAKASSLPEQKRVELIQQVAVPQNFKPMVKGLDIQTEKLAAANASKLTKDPIKSAAEFANNLGPKDTPKLPPQAVQAYAIQGAIVQDQVAAKLAQEGKIDKVEAVAAMSPIGQKAVIQSLPPQQRAVVAKGIENEKPEIVKEAEDQKKQANTGAFITAAAIAAKVLLF